MRRGHYANGVFKFRFAETLHLKRRKSTQEEKPYDRCSKVLESYIHVIVAQQGAC